MAERREVVVGGFGLFLLYIITLTQCSADRAEQRQAKALERIAGAADVTLCVRALEAGVDLERLPEMCRDRDATTAKTPQAAEGEASQPGPEGDRR